MAGRKSPSSDPTTIQRRIGSLIELLQKPRSYTAAELARDTGLRPQQVALALAALGGVGHASRSFDAARRCVVWSGTRPDQRSSVNSPLRTQYTVAEAALLTRRTEKALRRRIERRTLETSRSGRRIWVSHAALQRAGLVDNRMKSTHTTGAVRIIVDRLRRQPRQALSAWQLSASSGIGRQSTEVVVAALTAAGLVERDVAGGVVWRWVGD
jgi:hypothetical protein